MKGKYKTAPSSREGRFWLLWRLFLDVSRDLARHLEHVDLAAAEDLAKGGVGLNHAAVVKVVTLDVLPELFHDLPAGHWALAYDLFELGRELLRCE